MLGFDSNENRQVERANQVFLTEERMADREAQLTEKALVKEHKAPDG
jgi:hypothetical protein